MNKRGHGQRAERDELYRLLELLDRLEELIEDMEELGVSSRGDAEAQMREIHARVDELDTPQSGPLSNRAHARGATQ
jgi:hypothetical protein